VQNIKAKFEIKPTIIVPIEPSTYLHPKTTLTKTASKLSLDAVLNFFLKSNFYLSDFRSIINL
jgi:hypothetical protein